MNRPVRTRLQGSVGAGGEKPLATRFRRKAPGQGAGRSQHRDSRRRSRRELEHLRFNRSMFLLGGVKFSLNSYKGGLYNRQTSAL